MTDRSARRAALRATHPDLGGNADDFIAVVRAFDGPSAATTAVAPAWGSGATAPTTRPSITTTRRSRASRRARRTRRRLRAMTPGWLPAHQYAHLLEERT
ncbi:hypothetical protein L2K70_05805 [Nocardioides KLBMP 9356]|uniref:J domain-containing protein n=1 Tax=Nocardioides potassii TaxID=2911371 RepID=A0ABS9HAR0_9ACTN|nr:hypothetical protein [Nocardioides potassii]MCF6377108.1 hypothetical protein [Nocardioides potassii]